jgi:hypothetical protein
MEGAVYIWLTGFWREAGEGKEKTEKLVRKQ